MNVSEIMTRDLQTIGPDDTVKQAAKLMDELNIGILPVHYGTRLVGVITDRDITIQAPSLGLTPTKHPVSDFMIDEIYYRLEDDSIESVTENMAHIQIRRMPVLDRDGRLMGMISHGDIATHASQYRITAEAPRRISEPSQPDRTLPRDRKLSHGSFAPRRS